MKILLRILLQFGVKLHYKEQLKSMGRSVSVLNSTERGWGGEGGEGRGGERERKHNRSPPTVLKLVSSAEHWAGYGFRDSLSDSRLNCSHGRTWMDRCIPCVLVAAVVFLVLVSMLWSLIIQ